MFKWLKRRVYDPDSAITGLIGLLLSGIFLAVVAVVYTSVVQSSLANVTGTAGTFASMAGWGLWISAFIMVIAPAVAIVYKAFKGK